MNFRKFKSSISKRYPNDTVVLAKYFDHIFLTILRVKERNKGTGTLIMNELCVYCDENNLIIKLCPTDTHGSEYERLILFYERFEFKFEDDEQMIRFPKNNS